MSHPDILVFLHGWSVTHTDTFGGLPERLAAEFAAGGRNLPVHALQLGRYISFDDAVRMPDLVRALEAAIRSELGAQIDAGTRLALITHSTGGPLAREWWWRYYAQPRQAPPCPMSHLVMLAPANFGSALAQLGKGRLSRIKSFAEGVEPGRGVLDWLEQGSPESWALNEAWIRGRFGVPGGADGTGVYPFVLTGQSIDRSLYDHLNPYTGESGSDGVVRVPSANLNAALLALEQGRSGDDSMLVPVGAPKRAPATAFRLISGASHSGKDMGILRSVHARVGGQGAEVVDAILRCLAVDSTTAYARLIEQFQNETAAVQAAEYVEVERVRLLPDRVHIHDPTSLVLFRLIDDEGVALSDYDLLLTGIEDDPDLLPEGFLRDRQRNSRMPGTLSFFFNHALMDGSPPIFDPRDRQLPLRIKRPGIKQLGLRLRVRPDSGFVHYRETGIEADPKLRRLAIRPNETTLIDIRVKRLVDRSTVVLTPASEGRASFKHQRPSGSEVE